jgi:hypothetical protein
MRRLLIIAACAALACTDRAVNPDLDSGIITGVVTNAGAAAAGAAVGVQLETCAASGGCEGLPPQGTMVVLSDAAGRYRLESLPAGSYQVAAFPPVGLSATPVSHTSVGVLAGQTTTLNVDFADASDSTVTPPSNDPVASVTVTIDKNPVVVGDSLNALALLAAAGGQPIFNRPITWSVDQPSRLTLEAFGQSAVMRALSAGSVTVTATSEGKSGSATVVIH